MASIKADNQEIQEWLKQTKNCSLQLPIFQRKEVWSYKQVENLLETILNGRPIGCLLLLKTNDQYEPHFKSRGIAGLDVEGKHCKFQLLDGQQRITALWRSLTGDYDRKFFVKNEQNKEGEYRVESHPTNSLWIDDPQKTYEDKKLIPIELLLSHKENKSAFHQWVDDAVKNLNVQGEPNKDLRYLEDLISELSEQVRTFEIPFLTLPPDTTKDEAIDVFLMTNTSSTSLTKFDIVVGDVQQKYQENLYAKIELVNDQIPKLANFISEHKIGDLLLKVACLRTGRPPIESHFRNDKVLEDVLDNFESITKGIEWTIDFLDNEKIWDSQRLPSEIPFRVIPALYEFVPKNGDHLAETEKIIRKYLWRCFLSDRYETTAATLLKSDYDGLKGILNMLNADVQLEPKKTIPIFNNSVKLPNFKDIQSAKWPRYKNRIARALLAISIKRSGRDLVTNVPISAKKINNLQYHHLFPKGYLNNSNLKIETGDLMMNCVLIQAKSNQKLSSKPPLEYLKARIGGTTNSKIKESDIQSRLSSHLVPYEELCKVSGSIKDDYENFIDARTKLFIEPIKCLTDGEPWP